MMHMHNKKYLIIFFWVCIISEEAQWGIGKTGLICESLNCDKLPLISQYSDQTPNQRPTKASLVYANGPGEAMRFMQHLCGVQICTSPWHSLSTDCNLKGKNYFL